MNLNSLDYRNKVLGCWMGKNIGGTLGAPMEWRRQVNDVSFYTQKLTGEPLPNDDLDIQLIWLIALERLGLDLNAQILADYWCTFVAPHWCEYGTGKVNMRAGLLPPLSGSVDNDYKDSCGSFIRSEIWACIAPGLPHIAATYAYHDSILDHGNGEGTYAAMFTAALESAAFVCSDVLALIDIALSYIPADCGVAAAVKTAIECHQSGQPWLAARNTILEKYRGCPLFNNLAFCSKDDIAKGFHTGKLGYDVPSNIGMLIIALLYGAGDFANTVCTAVNCGEDTDCTGATVGALFGIIHGIAAIPEKWITPIGHGINTIAINRGDNWTWPETVDDLTARSIHIANQLLLRHNFALLSDQPTNLSDVKPESLRANGRVDRLLSHLGGPFFTFPGFEVALDYHSDPFLRDNTPKPITLRIFNNGGIQSKLLFRIYTPEGLRVLPASTGTLLLHPGPHKEITLTFLAECLTTPTVRAVIEITVDSRPVVMLLPVLFHNANLQPTA